MESLLERCKEIKNNELVEKFYNLLIPILLVYNRRLREDNKKDFTDLMVELLNLLSNNGENKFFFVGMIGKVLKFDTLKII